MEGQLQLAAGEQFGALGEFAQKAGLTDAAALEAVGQTQRGMPQASLDLAYQDFQEQRDYPQDQTQFMSEIIRGLPASVTPSSATTTSVGPADIYQPSGLAQIASAYGTYRGMTSARGGLIQSFPKKRKSPELHLRYYAEGGLNKVA
jgi:hypothetical protein